MNREQLAHVLRAAATIVSDGEILVVGSQAILGTADAPQLPVEATLSIEADLAFFDDHDSQKSDAVDGAIGEGSQFHAEFGYYAQGVSLETAVLPAGWRERLIRFDREDARPSQASCIDPHDLVIAKLVANRDKDRAFSIALIQAELIQVRALLDRVELLDQPGAVKDRVRTVVEHCAKRAGHG